MSKRMRVESALPGQSTQLAESTAEIVKDMHCPAIDTHSIVHIVYKVFKQQLIVL